MTIAEGPLIPRYQHRIMLQDTVVVYPGTVFHRINKVTPASLRYQKLIIHPKDEHPATIKEEDPEANGKPVAGDFLKRGV